MERQRQLTSSTERVEQRSGPQVSEAQRSPHSTPEQMRSQQSPHQRVSNVAGNESRQVVDESGAVIQEERATTVSESSGQPSQRASGAGVGQSGSLTDAASDLTSDLEALPGVAVQEILSVIIASAELSVNGLNNLVAKLRPYLAAREGEVAGPSESLAHIREDLALLAQQAGPAVQKLVDASRNTLNEASHMLQQVPYVSNVLGGATTSGSSSGGTSGVRLYRTAEEEQADEQGMLQGVTNKLKTLITGQPEHPNATMTSTTTTTTSTASGSGGEEAGGSTGVRDQPLFEGQSIPGQTKQQQQQQYEQRSQEDVQQRASHLVPPSPGTESM